MHRKSIGKYLVIGLIILFAGGGKNAFAGGPIIIDHKCTNLAKVPYTAIIQAKEKLHVAYGHTSHGSQLISGMTGLDDFMYNSPRYKTKIGTYTWHDGPRKGFLDIDDRAFSDKRHDLGYDRGRNPWWKMTRSYLDDPVNTDVNVVIWSWCNIYGHDINKYLHEMEKLISEYGVNGRKVGTGKRKVPVTFVFMTGHTNNDTHKRPDENIATFRANKKIRRHCIKYKRVLYDFYDIEAYDLDGKYFGDGDKEAQDNAYGSYTGKHKLEDDCSYNSSKGRGNWALEWQANHKKNVDWWASGAAHSKHLNGNLKGYAAWWLWARLAGWNGVE